MFEQVIDVTTSAGLHARPAGRVTELAASVPFEVEIGRPGEEYVDAVSILAVMGLGINQGDKVSLRCQTNRENPDATRLIEEIVAVLTSDNH